MDDTFKSQQIRQLGEYGYIESSAYADFFDPLFAACKAAHPTVRFVDKVGPNAIGQIIFLPKAKKRIRARLHSELAAYAKAAEHTTAAIKILEKDS